MSENSPDSAAPRKQVLFLFPLMYRPQKDNVASFFILLSRWYYGNIFALSGGRQRNVPVGDFLFHSSKQGNSTVGRFFSGLWIQVAVPLRLLWRRSSVAVVVSYDPYRSGLAALMLKYLLRSKMIVEINGDYHRVEPEEKSVLKQALMKFVFNLTLRGADAIKVLNADQEAFCRGHMLSGTIFRVPPFVATEFFQSLETVQGDFLLSVGYPFDLKGMDLLIEAFKLIEEKHPRTNLRIMGYCSQKDMVKYRALTAGHIRISFVEPGWIEEVGEQMRCCYALVNAGHTEAFGRVHIEAMACGKPIVATRTNGALECIKDGETGLLCAVGDVEDLAMKLDELLSNPERASQMGRAGKTRMQELFSEKVITAKFQGLLQEVIGCEHAP